MPFVATERAREHRGHDMKTTSVPVLAVVACSRSDIRMDGWMEADGTDLARREAAGTNLAPARKR